MPQFPVQTLILGALSALLAPLAMAAEKFEIRDSEGFDRVLEAHVATVPDGWKSEGRIAWRKPCSSNDLYETLFVTRSPDGQYGARIMPGYQFFQDMAQLAPGYGPDPMLDMMVAQSKAMNQNMATEFRGSNCGVGQLGGTQDILTRLILPNRPTGAKILRATPNTDELNMMRQTFGAAVSGVSLSFDAQIVDLEYMLNSVPTLERLYLSWYNFSQEPLDMGGVIVANSHTIIEPLRFVWSRKSHARQGIPQLESLLYGIETNPDWQRRVNKVREDIRKRGDAARVQRDAENDRKHKEFIESITGTPSGSVGGGSGGGSVGIDVTPDTGSAEPKEETDFWGEPKEETDFWGDPIKKDDT